MKQRGRGEGGSASAARLGVLVRAEGLTRRVKGGGTILNDVSLTIEPGELVAIAGGSGAGKTTLLDALAGLQPADSGRVRFDALDLYENVVAFRQHLGYVPQDDIIHAELPLERTLRYAARLRLPVTATLEEIDESVHDVLRALELEKRSRVRVAALSGGQRKRASIAVELLTRPRAFFLDEPTSGLDPATSADLLRVLRRLADSGATVVFTTHAVQDLRGCDRVVFLAQGGNLAFVGTPAEALDYFEVEAIERIYDSLANEGSPEDWAARHRRHPRAGAKRIEPMVGARPPEGGRQAGGLRQWAVLSQRTFETLVRNKLTLAILLGSPALVVAMFVILFRPGAFNFESPEPSAILMILFWVTFGAFFFGITYGLLQIVTERAILRREHLVGLRLGPYLLAKATVLLPFVLIVVGLMLVILRALDRLPSASVPTYLSVGATLGLLGASALALGLFTSAGVSNASQATLALSLLSFPAVLFSGAILPVHIMPGVGKAIAALMPTRWAFEAVGHDLGVRQLLTEGGSPLGPPLVATYGDAGMDTTGFYWAILGAFTAVFLMAAWYTLRRTVTIASRRS